MSSSRPVHSFAFVAAPVMFALVLLASVSNARADTIYNIVDYPANENGYTVSGTITTDGTTGPLTTSNILSGYLVITNLGGSTSPIPLDRQNCTIYPGTAPEATTGEIQVPTGCILQLEFGPGPTSDADFQLTWSNDNTQFNGYGYTTYYVLNQFYTQYFHASYPQPGPGSIGGDGSWTIANGGQPVPEPGTLTLLVSALLGLGALYVQRRRAKA